MITVIASLKVKAGRVPEYIDALKSYAPKVHKEKGCIEYRPTVDFDTGLPTQAKNENVITIIEKWETMECLLSHMKTPDMAEYKQKVKDILEDLTIKALQDI